MLARTCGCPEKTPKSISECPLLFNIPVGDFYLTYLLESSSKPDMNLIHQAFYLTLLGNLTDCKWNLPLKFSMLRVFCKTTSAQSWSLKKIFFKGAVMLFDLEVTSFILVFQ